MTVSIDIGIVKNHMNKKHWNTILLDGSVPDKEVFSWIDHSYDLIIGKK
jgi:predicted DNA-binding protein (MmcQ/YjbR family)